MTTRTHRSIVANALVLLVGAGACASSEREVRSSAPPPTDDAAAPRVEPSVARSGAARVCNVSLTECHTQRVDTGRVDRRSDPPTLAGAACTPGADSCRYVEIEAVGDGDIHWDASQSLAGLTCSLDADGLRMEWGDGFYLGRLDDCSNGLSYDFRYVRVHRVLGL